MPRLEYNMPPDPIARYLRGNRPETETTDLGYEMRTEPGLDEKFYQYMKESLTDPSNIGTPGFGISYQGAKNAFDELINIARRSNMPNVADVISNFDPASRIHPDALWKVKTILSTGNPHVLGQVKHHPKSLDTLNEWIQINNRLLPRGYWADKGRGVDLRYNVGVLGGKTDEQIMDTLQHEIEHLNHFYDKQIPLPAYDLVQSNPSLAKRILRSTQMESGEPASDLGYYFNNLNELLAEVGARKEVFPDVIRSRMQQMVNTDRYLAGLNAQPFDDKIVQEGRAFLDSPVYRR